MIKIRMVCSKDRTDFFLNNGNREEPFGDLSDLELVQHDNFKRWLLPGSPNSLWRGIVAEIADPAGTKTFEICFEGSDEDFAQLKSAVDKAGKEYNITVSRSLLPSKNKKDKSDRKSLPTVNILGVDNKRIDELKKLYLEYRQKMMAIRRISLPSMYSGNINSVRKIIDGTDDIGKQIDGLYDKSCKIEENDIYITINGLYDKMEDDSSGIVGKLEDICSLLRNAIRTEQDNKADKKIEKLSQERKLLTDVGSFGFKWEKIEEVMLQQCNEMRVVAEPVITGTVYKSIDGRNGTCVAFDNLSPYMTKLNSYFEEKVISMIGAWEDFIKKETYDTVLLLKQYGLCLDDQLFDKICKSWEKPTITNASVDVEKLSVTVYEPILNSDSNDKNPQYDFVKYIFTDDLFQEVKEQTITFLTKVIAKKKEDSSHLKNVIRLSIKKRIDKLNVQIATLNKNYSCIEEKIQELKHVEDLINQQSLWLRGFVDKLHSCKRGMRT